MFVICHLRKIVDSFFHGPAAKSSILPAFAGESMLMTVHHHKGLNFVGSDMSLKPIGVR
jgi:hypothetical protein